MLLYGFTDPQITVDVDCAWVEEIVYYYTLKIQNLFKYYHIKQNNVNIIKLLTAMREIYTHAYKTKI